VQALDEIASKLSARTALEIRDEGIGRAGVAMLLREAPGGPQVLFIERARREGDPWSGHMAFPGGRLEAGDAGVRAAAERETLEEVGISLAAARCLGRLDDKAGNPRIQPRLVISAWVFELEGGGEPVLNHEVQQVIWFPLAGLLVGEPGRHVVWGLTYSFLESFFRAVECPLPDRWDEKLQAYARGMLDEGR